MLKEYIKQILESRINKEDISVAIDYLLQNNLAEAYLNGNTIQENNVREYIHKNFDLGELGGYRLEVELVRILGWETKEVRDAYEYRTVLPNGRYHNDKGSAVYQRDFIGRKYGKEEYFINGNWFFSTTWQEIVQD